MGRTRTYKRDSLLRLAMERFWRHGYGGTSIEDLVHATSVGRHGIYKEFGDKRGVFLAVAKAYHQEVVESAIAPMKRAEAGVCDVRSYFERQIELGAKTNLRGLGCLLANTLTETAPHDPEIGRFVAEHLERLTQAFANALGEARWPERIDEVARHARALAVFAQGLWSVSRIEPDASRLRESVDAILEPIEARFAE